LGNLKNIRCMKWSSKKQTEPRLLVEANKEKHQDSFARQTDASCPRTSKESSVNGQGARGVYVYGGGGGWPYPRMVKTLSLGEQCRMNGGPEK